MLLIFAWVLAVVAGTMVVSAYLKHSYKSLIRDYQAQLRAQTNRNKYNQDYIDSLRLVKDSRAIRIDDLIAQVAGLEDDINGLEDENFASDNLVVDLRSTMQLMEQAMMKMEAEINSVMEVES